MDDRPATLSDIKMLIKLLTKKEQPSDELNVPEEFNGLPISSTIPDLPGLGSETPKIEDEGQIDQIKNILPDGVGWNGGPTFENDNLSVKIGKDRGSVSFKPPSIPKPFEKLMLDLGYDGSIAAEAELKVMKNGKLKIGGDSRNKSISLGFEMPF